MKATSILIASLLMASTSFAAKTAEAGSYAIDAAHSKVGFEVGHLVVSTVEGRFLKFDGTIVIDSKVANSKVDAKIDVASIDTGVEKRDGHLKSDDFFSAAKIPSITFVSKKVTGSLDKGLKVTGDLTIKGVTKETTLNVKYLGEVKNDGMGSHRVAFSADGKINRKDFGLTYGNAIEAGPVIGDEVSLSLKIEATQPVAAAAAPKK